MKVLLDIQDNKAMPLLEVLKSLPYVKKIETENQSKRDIIKNIKKGFEEMKLIKKGKLKTTSLEDFLNEL